MIKAILMFVGGNAFWDELVEFFGSTENVVAVSILLVAVILIIRYFKIILWIVLIIVILLIFFS
ncbi:MAG: hypothetical protein IJT73_06570 [Selenomonadaceae bacterium]|nr:hypothetical protein [Selenomonadaceae bacterium]